MPRLPIDYSKTIIYKLCCNDVNIKDIYVGHTTDITRRRQRHKESCNYEKNKEYNQYKYQFIRDNGGWDNWTLIPVEEFPCSNVNQAKIRERYWIETLEAKLNKIIPSRTKKEYYETNNDYYKEYMKEYRETNKKNIKEKQNEKFKCDCGGCYTKANMLRHLKSKKHQNFINLASAISF